MLSKFTAVPVKIVPRVDFIKVGHTVQNAAPNFREKLIVVLKLDVGG